MPQHQQDIMALIQALSNERLKLYGAKWSKRNRPTYRETIKRLDKHIADLWHEYRCELASPYRRSALPQEVEPVIIRDYMEHTGRAIPATGSQVYTGDGWQSIDDKALSKALGRYIFDIPADDPDDIVEVPPLKEILRKRGLKMKWQPIRGGSGYHRLSPL